MPQYTPPEVYPDWAESADALVSQPTPSQRASGFVLGERPTAHTTNWLFQTIGRSLRWLSQGVNATLLGSEQQFDWRLIGGGSWSWAASSGVLAWSETFALAMPGLTDAANSCAAGSVTLTAGQVAYANCNAPFSTTGRLESGSKTVSDLAFESGIVVGATVTGTGLPAGVTVTDVSASNSSITLSAAATASSAKTPLVFATSGPLTVKAADTASFAPSVTTVVLARCVAVADMPNHVVVGLNAGVMLLRDGEQKRLLATGYVSTFTAPAGADMPARTPVYISPGGTQDANRTAGAAYPLETASTAARASFAGITASSVLSGSRVEIVNAGRVAYAANNLLVGIVYYGDPATPGGITSTAPTATGQYVVPAGVALTTGMLLVTARAPSAAIGADLVAGAITASSVTTPGGIKSVLPAGKFFHSQAASGVAYTTFEAVVDVQAGTAARIPFGMPMTHAGSIVGISARSFGPSGGTVSVIPQKNNASFVDADGRTTALAATTLGSSRQAYARGANAFVAGDVLTCTLNYGASGNQLCEVFFTLELTTA